MAKKATKKLGATEPSVQNAEPEVVGRESHKMLLRSKLPADKNGEKVNMLKAKKVCKMKGKKNNKGVAGRKLLEKNKPKKPPTAFFYYLEDFRKGYLEQNPDVKSMRDVGKACGEKWKTMSYDEKVKYYDIATAKRAEFDKAILDYNKKLESGEIDLQESETDSE